MITTIHSNDAIISLLIEVVKYGSFTSVPSRYIHKGKWTHMMTKEFFPNHSNIFWRDKSIEKPTTVKLPAMASAKDRM
jgi:hypothetical protein